MTDRLTLGREHALRRADSPSKRRMKRFALGGAACGLFLIMMIAAAVQGTPTVTPRQNPAELPSAAPIEEPSPMPSMTPAEPDPTSDAVAAVIGTIFFALLAAVVLVIIVLVVRALVRAWRDRPLRISDGIEVGAALEGQPQPAEPEAAAPAIRRGIAGALRMIDDRPVPNDAIIAAWLGLEESAADVGITRGLSETPSEFALRIMTQRASITDAARELLRLYERVRFGGYVAQESDRDAARASLQCIEEGWR